MKKCTSWCEYNFRNTSFDHQGDLWNSSS